MSETKVLLVDDEEDFVAVLAERLSARGLEVDTATSGAAAGEISPWVLVGGLLLIGGVGLWWWLGSRRK